MNISGFTVIKNAISLDYCAEECIYSMLPVCDEVVVGEMGSTDGTVELLEKIAANESRVRIVRIRDWTAERGLHRWWVNAINETRAHLRFRTAVQMDGDEILSDDPATHEAIRRCAERDGAIVMDRLNFVRDAHSLIPTGECIARYVTRCGPSRLVWCSDDPTIEAQELLNMATPDHTAKIFHVGYLRRDAAFYNKSRVVQGAFFDTFDSRLVEAEKTGVPPMSGMPWWDRVVRYDDYYPESVKAWLLARDYKI